MGLRAGRSTKEQIFNLSILSEKYLQQNLYHIFKDFKRAFDRVSHETLWATMKKENMNVTIIRVIEPLYDKVHSAVLFNGSSEDCFRFGQPTINVRFTNDVVNTKEEEEADVLVDSCDTNISRYTMEISSDKTKMMLNTLNGF